LEIAKYFAKNGWITPKLLLNTAKKIKVPVVLVQGRYDMVCPPSSALQLKQAIPHAKLCLLLSGHAMSEKAMVRTLRKEIANLFT
jgi:proline iminopeptidase